MNNKFTISITDEYLGNHEVSSIVIFNGEQSTVDLYPFKTNLDLSDSNLFLKRISESDKESFASITDLKELFERLQSYSDGVIIVSYGTELGVYVAPNRIADGLRIISNRFNNFEHIKNLSTSEMNLVCHSYNMDNPNEWKLLFPIGLTIKEVPFNYLLEK